MARGRIITNKISRNKQVNDLSDDTCRLLFTWMITFTDRDGRMFGDPAVVRNMIFARRTDITVEQVESYLQEMVNAGLIIWYEAGGDKFIWFPGFDNNQPGLRRDREPESEFPPPSDDDIENYMRQFAGCLPDNIRNTSGYMPENVGLKLNLNLREIKDSGSSGGNARARENFPENQSEQPEESPDNGQRPNIFRVYEHEIGPLTPMIADKILAAEAEYPPGWIEMAISEAVSQNARKWSYVAAILQRWKTDGLQPIRGSPRSGNHNAPRKPDRLDEWARKKSQAAGGSP